MANAQLRTDANWIDFGDPTTKQKLGTLRQVTLHSWKEDSDKDGRDRFELTETNRDQWSIYLFDSSRKVSLQVDLFKKIIYYSDPNAQRRAQYGILSSASQPTGWLANHVEYGSDPKTIEGSFKQVGATDWSEDKTDGKTAFKFSETGRDDSSVYLLDSSRNVRIQLDLSRSIVLCQSGNEKQQELYKVISASAKVNGWLVNEVDYVAGGTAIAGSLRQTDSHTWIEENSIDGKTSFQFTETGRDDWSVYLKDSSRNVSLQLDLFEGAIFYSDPKNPRRQLYTIGRADVLPLLNLDNGKTVNLVAYGDSTGKLLGHFRQTSEQTWSEDSETKGRNVFAFSEIARDDWSVYLYDASRKIWIQADLYTRKIMIQTAGAQPQALYDVLSTSSVLNGWLVNVVEYNSSPTTPQILRQVGWTAWAEYKTKDSSLANHFNETGRDDWSVYLTDPTRGVKLQVDLYRKKILYAAGNAPLADLCDITAKGHQSELWRLSHKITVRPALTQDFDLAPNGGAPVARPVYRASVSVPVQVTSVDVWASEEVKLTINDTAYTIDQVQTATVRPSVLSKLSISIPATEVGCPTLFLRTNLMKASDPPHIVTPDVEVHRKINNLPDGAMYAARQQLGISAAFNGKPADVGAVQKSLQNLTAAVQYSYNDTYHGVHHDRAVLPSNMSDSHFELDFSSGGAAYNPLTKQQVVAKTQNARRVTTAAAQDLGDDFRNWFHQSASIVVHTMDSVGNTIDETATHAAKGLSQSISAVGEDVIHGDLQKAGMDLYTGGENLGKTLVKGTETALGEAASGAQQELAITFKLASETVQVLIADTAALGKAINSLLDKLGTEAGKLIGWLLDKVGWGDVMHTQPILLDALNNRLDQGLAFFKNAKSKADNFFNQQAKALDSAIDQAMSAFGVEKLVSQQPATPAELSGAIEKVEWLFGKLTNQSQGSALSIPGLTLISGAVAHNPLTDFISIVASKVGADGSTIIAALGDAYEHLKRLFNNNGSTPQDLLGVVLELVRAAAHIGLDIVSAVVDAILDMVITAIPQLKTFGNTALDIPFVSSFYEGLTNGQKLTPFGLAAFVVAIPLTLLHQAIEGKRPFDHVGAAQEQSGIPEVDDPVGWSYAYATCQLVLSISSAANDAINFAKDRKTRQADNNSIPMQPMNQADAGGLQDVPDEPLPPTGQIEAGPDAGFHDVDNSGSTLGHINVADAGGLQDARDEPLPRAGQVGAGQDAGFREVEDPARPSVAGNAGDDLEGFEDAAEDGNPAETEMAEFSWLDSMFGAINLSVGVISSMAGAPVPLNQEVTMPDYGSVKDVFEAPNYFSNVSFMYGCACFAFDSLFFVYTMIGTRQQSITAAALAQAQSYVGLFDFVRGLAGFALMITLYVFDEKKYSDFQAKMNDTTDPTFATQVVASTTSNSVQLLSDLETYVSKNYQSVQLGGPVTDPSTAQGYLTDLANFYNWARGSATNPVILGISEKTFGNCMDTFPDIGQLGVFKPLVEATEGISLLVTVAFDGIAHLAEGITYAVRTKYRRLY